MRNTILCTAIILFSAVSAIAQQIGDTVVVIQDAEIKVGDKVLQKLSRGITLKVHDVKDDWLWVSNEATGWIKKSHVTSLGNAVNMFTEQIRLNSKDAGAYFARALVWLKKNEIDIAIGDYNEALRLNPTISGGYTNRGLCFLQKGDFDRSIADHSESIRLDPTSAVNYSNRSEVLVRVAEFEKAVADASESLRLSPMFSTSYRYRGMAYLGQKQFTKAMSDFEEALKIDSKRASAYALRGAALAASGKYDSAVKDFDHAISLDENDEYVRFVVARFYATCPEDKYRDGQKAVEFAKKACESENWNSADFLDVLAAAYAETGDFKKAVEWETKAVERASQKQKDDFQARLELFKLGRPYRATLSQ